MTDEEVTVVHDRVMKLIRLRHWNQAAELADTVSELPNFHPWNPSEKHWGLCENLGDKQKQHAPARAVRLYKMALETLRRIASGNEDQNQQPGIERLENKIQLLANSQDKL